MKLKYLLTSFAIIGLISCSDGPEVNQDDLITRHGMAYLKTSTEPFTGVGIRYYGFGGKKKEDRYKNGYSHGMSYTYFSSGAKETEEKWDDGYKLSVKSWYLTGELRIHIELTGDNTNTGIAKTWWINGDLKGIYSMENGKVVPGSQTYWDMDGNEIK